MSDHEHLWTTGSITGRLRCRICRCWKTPAPIAPASAYCPRCEGDDWGADCICAT